MSDMQLTTPVNIPAGGLEIGHSSRILLLGSCFAQNIGNRLAAYKFNVCSNPFGIAYNPLSIATILDRILTGEEFREDSPELLESNGKWHSILHHSDFSRNSREELLHTVNSALAKAKEQLDRCDIITVTFGTAYVYTRCSDGLIVSNCHKLPAKMFNRRLLSIGETTERMSEVMRRIIERRPDVKFLFTVSPIRHLRDGAHDNQKSKATLLLAVDELQRAFPANCAYFPAYEIMLDELRDYRFYADDMVHPSPLAIEYIWQKFADCYIDQKSMARCSAIDEINKGIAHRPFDEKSEGYKTFIKSILQSIEKVNSEKPLLDFTKEIERCNTLLEI